jgi:Zn-dependent peptidase ImmA (M78 family)
MNLLLSRILEVFPHFNETEVTERDFWRACKQNRVIVRELPLMVDGYYEVRRGRHYILINNRLTGIKWRHTALHEFCHFLFDVPDPGGQALFSGHSAAGPDPREMLADAFALTCLLPFPELVRLASEGVPDDPWLMNLAGARVMVRTTYGW